MTAATYRRRRVRRRLPLGFLANSTFDKAHHAFLRKALRPSSPPRQKYRPEHPPFDLLSLYAFSALEGFDDVNDEAHVHDRSKADSTSEGDINERAHPNLAHSLYVMQAAANAYQAVCERFLVQRIAHLYDKPLTALGTSAYSSPCRI